ncbi:lysozyme [Nesidiocoris tenuis]|uniref:Lysozyme n=1 Tax=Nesidiocoris tenuis TaxID=355587 RepID=A0ABN7B967_9HEMI|nr:lysozyme [Nesidiocoris tenuis]
MIITTVLVIGAIGALDWGADAKIFEPCELAQELHRIIDLKFLYREISLLVCVAGFQNYDTGYFSKKPDGSYYTGIFGIHSSTIKWMARHQGNLTDDDIADDLSIFTEHVLKLDFGERRDDTIYDFYSQNCMGDDVERLNCYLNPYVTKDFIVHNPKGRPLPGRGKNSKSKNNSFGTK